MNEKRRSNDNGMRKFINPGWAGVTLMVLGYIVLLVASIKTIPVVIKDVKKLRSDVTIMQTNYKWILKGIDELKDILKEK